jgi:phosphoglycolate phosphatase-like HAD superfamily hydrolase
LAVKRLDPLPAAPASVVFLLDVDNTLLDNDRVTEDLREHLTRDFGATRQKRYWAIFERLRGDLGYADYLGALQAYRAENPRDPHMLRMSSYLLEYPFAERLFPGALDVIRRLSQRGPAVILSDGDAVFQPRKVERSGLYDAVEGRVLIYIHKEHELDDVERRFPARRYVLVDDKPRILSAVKSSWGSRLTTVFVRQGHYARGPGLIPAHPPPDVALERIGDLLQIDPDALAGGDI